MEQTKEDTKLERGFDQKTCDILKRSLPEHSRRGPGGTYSYHKGSDVIKLLNEAFGHSWSSERIEEKEQDDQVLILVSLSVMSQTGDLIVHHGYGSAEIKRHTTTKKIINLGNVYKSAFTNALKKAAEQFGIGLGEEDEDEDTTSTSPRASGPPAGPRPTPTRPPTARPSMKSAPMPMGASSRPSMARPAALPPRQNSAPPAQQSLRSAAVAAVGAPSRPPTNPTPMATPDLGNQTISDTQKKALRNLATMKKRTELDLVQGALPNAGKTSFDELLKSEAIEVIKHANSLSQG